MYATNDEQKNEKPLSRTSVHDTLGSFSCTTRVNFTLYRNVVNYVFLCSTQHRSLLRRWQLPFCLAGCCFPPATMLLLCTPILYSLHHTKDKKLPKSCTIKSRIFFTSPPSYIFIIFLNAWWNESCCPSPYGILSKQIEKDITNVIGRMSLFKITIEERPSAYAGGRLRVIQ